MLSIRRAVCVPVVSLVVWCAVLGPSLAQAPATISVDKRLLNGATGRVTSDPAGIDCADTCSADFVAGTTVTLSATAGPGSFFKGFIAPCNMSIAPDDMTGNVTAVAGKDIRCEATFDVNPTDPTPIPTVPPAPVLDVTVDGNNLATATWTDPPELNGPTGRHDPATSYELFYQVNSAPPMSEILTTTQHQLPVDGLTASDKIDVWVVGKNSVGDSLESNHVTLFQCPSFPGRVNNLIVSLVGTELGITWEPLPACFGRPPTQYVHVVEVASFYFAAGLPLGTHAFGPLVMDDVGLDGLRFQGTIYACREPTTGTVNAGNPHLPPPDSVFSLQSLAIKHDTAKICAGESVIDRPPMYDVDVPAAASAPPPGGITTPRD